MKIWETADLFAGGGGTSTGLVKAIRERGESVNLVAINHDPEAVRTHEMNHPWATHFCQDVEKVNPLEAIPSGHLDLLVASPSCTHHSNALGGKPRNFQDRDDARIISNWAYRLKIDNILVENVPEFTNWGPLDSSDQPIKAQKGLHFNAWKRGLAALHYNIDYRILNAADYGDATSRRRLFLIARKGNEPITWPQPTHDRKGMNGLPRWRAAREIIDWTIRGESIFERTKPLSPNTMRRILEGIRKFGGAAARPFIIQMENGGHVDSIDSPLRTITANRKGGTAAFLEPFISVYHGGNPRRNYSVEDPIGTVDTQNRYSLIQPFIVQHNHNSVGAEIEDPLPTITKVNKLGIVEPFILSQASGGSPRSVDDPIPSTPTKGAHALIDPYLVEYYGNGKARDIQEPVPTIPTRDRFALIQPEIRVNGTAYRMDIRYRMLQPHELAAAMGFPEGYIFSGSKTDSVRMIGNAVAVNMAKSLISSLLEAPKQMTLEVMN